MVEVCSIYGFAPSRRLMRIGGGIKADLAVCSKVSTPQLIGIPDRPRHRWTLFWRLEVYALSSKAIEKRSLASA